VLQECPGIIDLVSGSKPSFELRLFAQYPPTILRKSRHYLEAEVGFQPTRTSKPFTGLQRNTLVWKVHADFGWKARHSRPESNKTPISENPPRIPPLFWHYPVTIWRRRSESHCITAPFQSSQPPCKSINYARSPVKSGFQRPLRKSRTILPIAFQNFLTILPVSFYWSFYWRSLPGFFEQRPALPSLQRRLETTRVRVGDRASSWYCGHSSKQRFY